MSEPKGLLEATREELVGDPTPVRALKILDKAEELGWTLSPATFVIRLTREDAIPFFARWDLKVNPETGKRSWGFTGARAQNGQPLNFNDIKVYLNDPDVIHPEPPTSPEDDTDEVFRTALGALDPLGPTASPLNARRPSTLEDMHPYGFEPTDWGALL